MITAVIAVTGATSVVDTEVAYGKITTEENTSIEARLAGITDTETIVREYFKDIPVMIQVARCESQFRHTLADGSVLQGRVDSDDTGVMQINKRYHLKTAIELGLDLDDVYDNLAYARDLYERKGTQPWDASSACWGRTLAFNK